MSTRPSSYYPWASEDGTHDFTAKDGTRYNDVPNKTEPFLEFKTDGFLYQPRIEGEDYGFPIQYLNYQMGGVAAWIPHLDQRLLVGDVVDTLDSTATAQDISQQYGGVWEYVGSDGLTHVWKKITEV